MDASERFSAAIGRAIEENTTDIKTLLLGIYHHRKHMLDHDTNLFVHFQHIGTTCKGTTRCGHLKDTDTFSQFVCIYYEWKRQTNILDGEVIKMISLSEEEMELSGIIYEATDNFDFAETMNELGGIITRAIMNIQ